MCVEVLSVVFMPRVFVYENSFNSTHTNLKCFSTALKLKSSLGLELLCD